MEILLCIVAFVGGQSLFVWGVMTLRSGRARDMYGVDYNSSENPLMFASFAWSRILVGFILIVGAIRFYRDF